MKSSKETFKLTNSSWHTSCGNDTSDKSICKFYFFGGSAMSNSTSVENAQGRPSKSWPCSSWSRLLKIKNSVSLCYYYFGKYTSIKTIYYFSSIEHCNWKRGTSKRTVHIISRKNIHQEPTYLSISSLKCSVSYQIN